jgi:hypothetical protein
MLSCTNAQTWTNIGVIRTENIKKNIGKTLLRSLASINAHAAALRLCQKGLGQLDSGSLGLTVTYFHHKAG